MFVADYVFARMPPNVDKYTWLFNLEGFGYSHMYLDAMKGFINTIQSVYVNTNQKLVCCYPNFVTRMVWKTLQPFLSVNVKNKVCFLDEPSE